MIREAADGELIGTAEFVYRFIFMEGEHNYLCAVCRKYKAVLICNNGILQPCWPCQKAGYEIVKKSRLVRWIRDAYRT